MECPSQRRCDPYAIKRTTKAQPGEGLKRARRCLANPASGMPALQQRGRDRRSAGGGGWRRSPGEQRDAPVTWHHSCLPERGSQRAAREARLRRRAVSAWASLGSGHQAARGCCCASKGGCSCGGPTHRSRLRPDCGWACPQGVGRKERTVTAGSAGSGSAEAAGRRGRGCSAPPTLHEGAATTAQRSLILHCTWTHDSVRPGHAPLPRARARTGAPRRPQQLAHPAHPRTVTMCGAVASRARAHGPALWQAASSERTCQQRGPRSGSLAACGV